MKTGQPSNYEKPDNRSKQIVRRTQELNDDVLLVEFLLENEYPTGDTAVALRKLRQIFKHSIKKLEDAL